MFSQPSVSHSVYEEGGYLEAHVLSGVEYLWYQVLPGGGWIVWAMGMSRGGRYHPPDMGPQGMGTHSSPRHGI